MQEIGDDFESSTHFGNGKLVFLSGGNICEFDGHQIKKKWKMRTLTLAVCGPFFLSIGSAFLFETIANVINARHSPIFLIPMLIFFSLVIVQLVRRGVTVAGNPFIRINSSFGPGSGLDLSRPEARAKLNQVYQKKLKQNGGRKQGNFFSYLIAITACSPFVFMIVALPVVTGNHLLSAIHGMQTDKVRTEEAKEAPAAKEKRLTAKLETQIKAGQKADAINTREQLACLQTDQNEYKNALVNYRQALAERWPALDTAVGEKYIESQLRNICTDAVWTDYLMKGTGDKVAAEAVPSDVLKKIDTYARSKKLDPYAEKRSFIRRVAKYFKSYDYNGVGKETNESLKNIESLPVDRRDAALNDLLKKLFDTMDDTLPTATK